MKIATLLNSRFLTVYGFYALSFCMIVLSVFVIKSVFDPQQAQLAFQIVTVLGFIATLDFNLAKYLILVSSDKKQPLDHTYLSMLIFMLCVSFVASALFYLLHQTGYAIYFEKLDLSLFAVLVCFAPITTMASVVFARLEIDDKFFTSTLLRTTFSVAPYVTVVLFSQFMMSLVDVLIATILIRVVITLICFTLSRPSFSSYSVLFFWAWVKDFVKSQKNILIIGLTLPMVVFFDRIVSIKYLSPLFYVNYIFISEILFKILAATAMASIVLVPRMQSSDFLTESSRDPKGRSHLVYFLIYVYLLLATAFIWLVLVVLTTIEPSGVDIEFSFFAPLFAAYAFAIFLQCTAIIQYSLKQTNHLVLTIFAHLSGLILFTVSYVTSTNFTFLILAGYLANLGYSIFYLKRTGVLTRRMSIFLVSFFIVTVLMILNHPAAAIWCATALCLATIIQLKFHVKYVKSYLHMIG